MPRHRKFIILIVLVSLAAFGNSLQNGFVGDDNLLFLKNTFYRSWENFPRLFGKDYISDSNNFDLYIKNESDVGSGSVAYRPVLSATFFVDYALWKEKPFGYHLHNLILHTFNSLLAYWFLFLILGNSSTALLAAVLFCVHPVKSEAVCSIGYRADSLAFFFALLSFIVFILHDRFTRPKKDIVLGVSWLFFALALFSKESAIVLPALIIAYDGYFRRDSWVTLARNFRARYGGHVLIAGIYLFLYFFVFRNLTLPNSRLFNNSLSVHVVTMAQIFWFYAVDLIFPFSIKMVPPVYAPPIDGFTLYRVIFSAGLLAALVYAGVRMSRSARPVSFFILWFLLGLLPVSNLIALPNPMAHRFLYLPSLGFLAVVAIAIEWLSVQIDRFRPLPHLSKILKTGLVALLILTTYSLNIFWRSDYTVAAELVERYPRDPKGYFFLGLVYFQHGLFENAKVLLNKSVELGTSDPRAFYTLGLCYSVFGRDFDRATEAFNKCIAVYPDFALPYIGVGRILLLQGDREKALPYFQKSLKLSPTYSAYGYLIQTFLLEGRTGEAEELLQEASAVLADQQDLRSLTRMLEQKDTPDYPVDIGI